VLNHDNDRSYESMIQDNNQLRFDCPVRPSGSGLLSATNNGLVALENRPVSRAPI